MVKKSVPAKKRVAKTAARPGVPAREPVEEVPEAAGAAVVPSAAMRENLAVLNPFVPQPPDAAVPIADTVSRLVHEEVVAELAAATLVADELDVQLKERDAALVTAEEKRANAAAVANDALVLLKERDAALAAVQATLADADAVTRSALDAANARIAALETDLAAARNPAVKLAPIGELEIWGAVVAAAPTLVAVFECTSVEHAFPGHRRVTFTPPYQLDAQNGIAAPTADRDRYKRAGAPQVTTGSITIVVEGERFVVGEIYRLPFETYPRA